MSIIDYVFLLTFVTALVVMLGCSKVLRAIAWDTVRHPFTRSRIEIIDGKVSVHRGEGASDQAQASQTHVSAR